MTTTYNIDRNTAARLLNVSVRTVDRYLKKDRLSSVKSDGRVWLSKEEILDLLRGKEGSRQTIREDRQSTRVDPDIIVDNGVNLSNSDRDNYDSQYRQQSGQPQQQRQRIHVDVDELYQELKEEVAIKEKRLAQASYKIGQLEAQIASMVPLLEFEKQQKLLAAKSEEHEKKLEEKEEAMEKLKEEYNQWLAQKEAEKQQLNEIRMEELQLKDVLIKQLDEDLHMEKVNKWVFAVVLYVVVVMVIIIFVALKLV